MPYSIEDLKKRPSYQKILESDKNELTAYIDEEEWKAELSGSTPDALRTLRDSNGCLLSFEDPDNPGKTYPSLIMKVRVPMTMFKSNVKEVNQKLEKDINFGSFRPNAPVDETPDLDSLRFQLEQKILEYDDPNFTTGPQGGKLQQVAAQEESLNEAIQAIEEKIAEM